MENHRFWECEHEYLLLLLYKTMPHDKALFVLLYTVFYEDIWEKISSISGFPQDELSDVSDSLQDREFKIATWDILKLRMQTVAPPGKTIPALVEITLRFDLNEIQKKILIFLFLFDRFIDFQRYIENLSEAGRIRIFTAYCGASELQIMDELKPGSPFLKKGLASRSYYPHFEITRYNVHIAIAKYISYFLDDSMNRALSSFYLDEVSGSGLSVADYDFPSETITAAKTILGKKGSGFIILYGEPGTGKTELSKLLPSLCGKKTFFLKRHSLDNNEYFSNFITALKLINNETEILVIDEADELLNTEQRANDITSFITNIASGRPSKGILNQLLDDFQGKIIFITNRIGEIPVSFLRRMHMHIGFNPFNLKQRKRIWESEFVEEKLLCKNEINEFSLKYRANPARIKQVAELCRYMDENGLNHEHIIKSAHDVLKRGELILTGSEAQDTFNLEIYDSRFLNISIKPDALLNRLEKWWKSYSEKCPGLNLLFHGLPGTGKSAFARYLADELGIPPVVRRASDLIDPFVGMTERNIRNSFREAEGCMLILDEVDSFIPDRQGSIRSWEKTMTNELLTCMEDFSGILVATTNFTRSLDIASFRRFSYKLEFRPPEVRQRKEMVSAFFPHVELSEDDLLRIEKLEGLTPGDVKSVKTRLMLSDLIRKDDLINELKSEIDGRAHHSRQIGFSA